MEKSNSAFITSYERDNETDLDFAQARMYVARLGRFTAVDPSQKSVNNTNPQTWNRYSYCINNPLIYIDANGKWPTETHDDLIRKAFTGLSDVAISRIQRGSKLVDTYFGTGGAIDIPITLIPSEAPKHAMTPEGMTKEDARAAAQEWVGENLNKAKRQQMDFQNNFPGIGLSGEALETFGKAAHTYMDNTSPSHTGFQDYKIPTTTAVNQDGTSYQKTDAAAFVAEGLEHKRIESRPPTPEEANKAILDMRLAFLATFGEKAFNKAVKDKKDREEVISEAKRQKLSW